MSRPHSANKTWAACVWTPGNRAQQLDQLRVRREHRLDPLVEVLDRGVERVDVRQQLGDHDAVVLDLEAAGERLTQLRDLGPHPGLRQLGELVGIGDPDQQRFKHRPSRLRVGLRRDAGELDPGVLEHLLHRWIERPRSLT